MHLKVLETNFAPAERSDKNELEKQLSKFWESGHLREIIENIPDMLLVLNKHRQILYGNKAFKSFININSDDEIIGLRPGEAIGCSNSNKSSGGCGTSEYCTTCGALKAILSSINDYKEVQDCSITCDEKKESYDLRVWANPIVLENEPYSVLTISNISDENRRKALERIFFHDIINTAGGLLTVSDLLKDPSFQNNDEIIGLVNELAERLIDEINAQKQLLAAENDELKTYPQPVKTDFIINQVLNTYKNHNLCKNKIVKIDDECWQGIVMTDETLLKRVLDNIVKNALEASDFGQQITISAFKNDNYVKFNVHNSSFIEKKIQYRIFQRSFSTKGNDRGLGTYSIKLLTEKYLYGEVSFVSTEPNGTTFTVQLPLKLNGVS